MTNQLLPIAIDLDGTLLHTDTLHESAVNLLHHHPLQVLLLPFWLMQGKAHLKQKLSEYVTLNPATLPLNPELIEWLKEQKVLGHRLILCTAADHKIANAIAAHLGFFDEVMASDGQTNLAGEKKKDALVLRFGEQGFIYAGNSNADLEVWKSAAKAVVVNADEKLIKKASDLVEIDKVFAPQPITFNSWRRVLRIHQYLKNILLFVPLAAAHQIGNIESLLLLLLAFVSFSLCASSVYITNDLLDLDSDRQHPRKCHRPFTSGVVPISYGVMLAPICLITSFALAILVGANFFAWLLAYFIVTVAYSLRLKRYALIDCLTLAALYTLRIIAGAAAVAISLSFWLLAFSIFVFLSLAFVKRYAELQIQIAHGNMQAHGRGYHVEDAPLIQTLGITAGYASVLVLALYLHSEAVMVLYNTPQFIWGSIPLMLFWISWVWLKAHRGEMHDDPIVFAVRDKSSLMTGVIFIATFIIAKLWVSP
jgi:4-hydroxybenzoate polyprenyltransferase/phosphoglycolate phosphatase-like HAD superfamily hydrolase